MANAPKRRRVNYLNNADILAEIHKSKLTFCEILDEKYKDYDLIIFEKGDINHKNLLIAREERINRINATKIRAVQKKLNCTPKTAKEKIGEENLLTRDDINDHDIVFRLMCNEWIPNDAKKPENKIRTNFKPFKHFILDEKNEIKEVVRSHWIGEFDDGKFAPSRGKLTEELGRMIIELCERTSNKSNFRGYSFLDEMVGNAKLQLTWNALNFDESRESIITIKDKTPVQLNPFAYFTTIVHNEFRAVLNSEKKNRNIRDDLLMEHGYDPSSTRLTEIEAQMIIDRKEKETKKETLENKNILDNSDLWDDK